MPACPTSRSFQPILEVLQPVAQTLMRHAQPGLHGPQGLVEPPRDLAVRQPLEVRQQHDAPLLIGKRGERRVYLAVQRPPAPGPPRRRRRSRRPDVGALHRLRLSPALALAPPAAATAEDVERPVARDPQYPRHQRSSPRVVLVDVAPDLHEHVAHYLLGLVLVVQNAKRETEHPAREEVVQLLERALVPCLEAPLQGALLHLTKTFWRGHLDSHTSSEHRRIQPRPCILKSRLRRWDGGSLPS